MDNNGVGVQRCCTMIIYTRTSPEAGFMLGSNIQAAHLLAYRSAWRNMKTGVRSNKNKRKICMHGNKEVCERGCNSHTYILA